MECTREESTDFTKNSHGKPQPLPESEGMSSESYDDLMDRLTILTIHEVAVDQGVIQIPLSWETKYLKLIRDEIQYPPNRPPNSSVDWLNGPGGLQRIPGSECLGRFRELGVTWKDFHANPVYKKNLDTLIYGAIAKGEQIPLNAHLMFSKTASNSDLILAELASTLMARFKLNPAFFCDPDYYLDEFRGVGVPNVVLKGRDLHYDEVIPIQYDFRNESWNQALSPSSKNGYRVHLNEDSRSLAIAAFGDILDLINPKDFRQCWHHRFRMHFSKGPNSITNPKVQWLICQKHGIALSTRNEALRSLLTPESLNDNIFIDQDQTPVIVGTCSPGNNDMMTSRIGHLSSGHWAVMRIFRNLHLSAIPRARRLLGLEAHPNFTANSNYKENRTVIPAYYDRLIPTMGYNSSTLYHPEAAETPIDVDFQRAVRIFQKRLAGSETESLEKAYTLIPSLEGGVKICFVWGDFDDLSSLQITAEMKQLQDPGESNGIFHFESHSQNATPSFLPPLLQMENGTI